MKCINIYIILATTLCTLLMYLTIIVYTCNYIPQL